MAAHTSAAGSSKRQYWMVPLSSHVAEAIRPYLLGKDDDDLVFTAARGGPLLYSNVYHDVWRPTCKAAGVTLSIHELRHTAVTSWRDAGVPTHVVQAFVGHNEISTTERYTHLTAGAVAQARAVRERTN